MEIYLEYFFVSENKMEPKSSQISYEVSQEPHDTRIDTVLGLRGFQG